MQFQLEKYHQGIVKVLLNHEERIENTEDKVFVLENTVKQLQEEIEKLKNPKINNSIII
jgi:chaperonin cofactor prefoldin